MTVAQVAPTRYRIAPAVLVLVVGLLATGCLVVATTAGQRANEARLLRQRVALAGLVVTSSVPTIQTPLASAAELENATGGSPAAFRQLLQPMVGPTQEFTSASVWRLGQAHPTPLVVLGTRPDLLAEPPAQINAYLSRAVRTASLAVVSHFEANPQTLGYSYRSSASHPKFVVYAERTLPRHRESVLQKNAAFDQLDYALYFGGAQDPGKVLTASTPHLPLHGRTATMHVSLGDAPLLLVMKAKVPLGGRLLAWLPWLIGGLGALLSLVFAALTARLVRRQADTERLAADNAELYADQRSVAQTLQMSLLPESLPSNAEVAFGVRYQAGVDGIDIGGDWYDVIPIDDRRILAVMGDVSGRGLGAATVMASLRYAIRAFASQGDDPVTILGKLNDIVDLARDGHFATVLLAEADVVARTVTVASAGHPKPLLIDHRGARFLEATPGVPVGVPGAPPSVLTEPVPAGATLLLFTDGLFERRGEVIDAGLDRLRSSAAADSPTLETLLSRIIDDLATGGAHDDTALLGMRWLN